MAVEVSWDDEARTIVKHVYRGNFTMADYREAARRSADLLRTVDHPVDIIVTAAEDAQYVGGSIFSATRYVSSIRPPNQRYVLVVSASLFIKALIEIGGRIAPALVASLYHVDTLDEAYEWLQARRREQGNTPS